MLNVKYSAIRMLICTINACIILLACSSPITDVGNDAATNVAASDTEAAFRALQPPLTECKTCHIQDGVAGDTQLIFENNDDYNNLLSTWQSLDKQSEEFLGRASGSIEHSGGGPWPAGSQPHQQLQQLLTLWESGATFCPTCSVDSGSGDTQNIEGLLGNPGKRMWANVFCENKPDSTVLDWSNDPRRLFLHDKGIVNNPNDAVDFNLAFEVLHTDALFENQQKQNEILQRNGIEPYHTAKREPTSCGEYKMSVQRGMDFLINTPTTFDIFEAEHIQNIWKSWGLTERPSDFEQQLQERYGLAGATDENPIPLPGEDPLATNGGSGSLPQMFVQQKNEQGEYTGRIGFTCLGCHVSRLGTGEVSGTSAIGDEPFFGKNDIGTFVGLPNNLQDLTVFFGELFAANPEIIDDYLEGSKYGDADGWAALVLHGNQYNNSRGVHAADNDILLMMQGRAVTELLGDSEEDHYDLYTSRMPVITNGDQDPPPWWWLHNKVSYLWGNVHSNDSARGNMYFGHVNQRSIPENRIREGIFEDLHMMTLSLEAPDYPLEVNENLARQGAILFHEKDLWASPLNAEISKPQGNGSCASCHGVYAERYANDPEFLSDPRLIGMAANIVPYDVLDTDTAIIYNGAGFGAIFSLLGSLLPATSNADGEVGGIPQQSGSFFSTIRYNFYTDARPGYLDPFILSQGWYSEEEIEEGNERYYIFNTQERVPRTNIIGITTPPLHGVWASAPYFHNGSVPSVWGVLKPSDRPAVWLRQQNPVGVTGNSIRGFDTDLSRAYDAQNLGWKYQALFCDNVDNPKPYRNCQPRNAADKARQDRNIISDVYYESGNLLRLPKELVAFAASVLTDGIAGVFNYFGDDGIAAILRRFDFEMPAANDIARSYSDDEINERMIYNTHHYSHKNTGHIWTQALTDTERLALIEYMKTL